MSVFAWLSVLVSVTLVYWLAVLRSKLLIQYAALLPPLSVSFKCQIPY